MSTFLKRYFTNGLVNPLVPWHHGIYCISFQGTIYFQSSNRVDEAKDPRRNVYLNFVLPHLIVSSTKFVTKEEQMFMC